MNRAALVAFALLCSSLVACTGETADDADDSDVEVTVPTETDLTPQEVAEKKKPKSEQQQYLVVKLENVLVSSY